MSILKSHPELIRPLLPKRTGGTTEITGLPGASLPWTAALLTEERKAPIILVTDHPRRAETLAREALFFIRDHARPLPILNFPAWETLPFEKLSPFGPLTADRLATLFRLAQMKGDGPILPGDDQGQTPAIVITTAAALMQRVMPRELLTAHGFALSQGDQVDLPALSENLVTSGYRNAAQVREPGEFAIRGGVFDLFPPGFEEPVRLELWGDEVETIKTFDPLTQRSQDKIPHVKALPVSEVILTQETIASFRTNYRSAFGGQCHKDTLYEDISQGLKSSGTEQYLPLFYERTDTLFDYLPDDSVFLLEQNADEAARIRGEEIAERHAATTSLGDGHRALPPEALYLPVSELEEKLAPFPTLKMADDSPNAPPSLPYAPSPDFDRERQEAQGTVLDAVGTTIAEAQAAGTTIAIALRTVSQVERMRELLEDHKLAPKDAPSWEAVVAAQPGSLFLIMGDLDRGFVHPGLNVMLMTEGEIFGQRVRRRRLDRRQLDQVIAGFAHLTESDLVVHADYGIGRYGGLHSLEVGGIKNDFLLIIYAGGDKLYAPVESLDRVSKYASAAEEAVLDRLGTQRWAKTKAKTKKKILEMAAELIALQAKREMETGFAFSGPDPAYQEFAASFPFEETPDQAQAIDAVLEDMAKPKPMDRLICGDVGFGKTEVALRAGFRAALDGRQTAVLTPTTILAKQHYETFKSRMAPYPITMGQLSRFNTPKQQRETLAKLAAGRIDIVVGTHRLLQKDVTFKDLGLVVVDEEQRFGVTHKEKLKKLRAEVDLLTLTATPIPRTMNMAMAGIRDISIIATPPVDRLTIRTMVSTYDRHQVREAILREIYRGGQVFYLYNQVESMEAEAGRLAELVPEARIGFAHGQMRENRLEKIMFSFYHQEFNVLVCSTIIENGVDIPSANTIIIHRADKFGLAQLHQLRGRVGRSKHRAYAYLLTPPKRQISKDALKRLDAIETLDDLGSGFMLASHDLEIRGAGNILGDAQSGNIREVGLELFNQMLKQAVRGLQGEQSDAEEQEIVPVLNLGLSTSIPESYVPDVGERLALYKRIAGLAGPEETDAMRDELMDRFGKLPESVENLLKLVLLKILCKGLKITKMEAGPKGGTLTFHEEPNINPEAIFEMITTSNGKVVFNQEARALSFTGRAWSDPQVRIKALGGRLAALQPIQA